MPQKLGLHILFIIIVLPPVGSGTFSNIQTQNPVCPHNFMSTIDNHFLTNSNNPNKTQMMGVNENFDHVHISSQ